MPLVKGKSHKAFVHNLKAELHAGKPKDQALAIAYSEKRQAEHKMAEGGEVHDESEDLMPHVISELFEAIETKNKQMGMDALKAIILHVLDEDQNQEEMES
jgi:hypothetical protein